MKPLYLAALAAAIALTSCGRSQAAPAVTSTSATVAPRLITADDFSRLHRGMPEKDVVAILGAPTSKTVSYDCGQLILCSVTYDRAGAAIDVFRQGAPR